jgi:transcription antitermination factor NusG
MDKNWYAIKVFFNKVFKMEDILLDMGLETYVAVQKVQLKGRDHMKAARILASADEHHRKDSRYIQEGPVIFERKPLVTSLVFVRADASEIQLVDARIKDELLIGRMLGFIYKTADWKGFAVIPDIQMDSFRLITLNGGPGLTFFSGDPVKFMQGDHVRVIDGPLKGAEGYIKRIKKDRRLLVCVEGVIAVATSYLPERMVEKITE